MQGRVVELRKLTQSKEHRITGKIWMRRSERAGAKIKLAEISGNETVLRNGAVSYAAAMIEGGAGNRGEIEHPILFDQRSEGVAVRVARSDRRRVGDDVFVHRRVDCDNGALAERVVCESVIDESNHGQVSGSERHHDLERLARITASGALIPGNGIRWATFEDGGFGIIGEIKCVVSEDDCSGAGCKSEGGTENSERNKGRVFIFIVVFRIV